MQTRLQKHIQAAQKMKEIIAVESLIEISNSFSRMTYNTPSENLFKEINSKKIELEELKHLKYIKEHFEAKERIVKEIQKDIEAFKQDYHEKIKIYKVKYN